MTQTTKASKRQPIKQSEINPDLFEPAREEVRKLKGRSIRTDAWFNTEVRYMIGYIRSNKKLRECHPESLRKVLVDAIDIGLTLNPIYNYGAPLTRYTQTVGTYAYYEPGYKGLLFLARQVDEIMNVESQVVYDGEKFEITLGSSPRVIHSRSVNSGKKAIIAAYAIAHMRDGSQMVEVIDQNDIESIKSQSESYKAANDPKNDRVTESVWHKWEGQMCRKAVIKRLYNYLPKSDALEKAIALDNNEYTVAPYDNKAGLIESLLETASCTPETKDGIMREIEEGISHDRANEIIVYLKDNQTDPVESGRNSSAREGAKSVENRVARDLEKPTGDVIYSYEEGLAWLDNNISGSVLAVDEENDKQMAIQDAQELKKFYNR